MEAKVAYLFSALDLGERSTSRSDRLSHEERFPATHYVGGVDLRAGLDVMAKIRTIVSDGNGSRDFKPTASQFVDRAFRKIFGPKREKDESWRKLHNDELHSLHSSSIIVRAIKSRG
jgi:hypothetical protein